MAEVSLARLLHARLARECMPIYEVGHWAAASQEALKQVELALKERFKPPTGISSASLPPALKLTACSGKALSEKLAKLAMLLRSWSQDCTMRPGSFKE